ncbi:hypothetical protein JB92DRAFT_121294 [Gautieria morchelliformis]|nr:hypothetical protein JB92DRAFT_121294 [Gautieria morchelliformis]
MWGHVTWGTFLGGLPRGVVRRCVEAAWCFSLFSLLLSVALVLGRVCARQCGSLCPRSLYVMICEKMPSGWETASIVVGSGTARCGMGGELDTAIPCFCIIFFVSVIPPHDPSDAHGQRYRQREGGIFSPRGSLTAWTAPRSRVAARLHAFFNVAVGVLRTSGPARGSGRYVPHGRYAFPTARFPAVHLRRGDFEQHCAGLERDSAGWQGINEADGLMDRGSLPFRRLRFTSG